MRRSIAVIVCAIVPILGACDMASLGTGSNQRVDGKTVGTLVGAVGGSLAATQLCTGNYVCEGIGIVLGGLHANTTGDVYDGVAQTHHITATYKMYQTGQIQSWQSSGGPVSGVVTPTGTRTINGSQCVQYTDEIRVKGEMRITTSGIICKQLDGSWKIYGG